MVLNISGWLVIQLGMAWIFTRMPTGWFKPAAAFAWETDGSIYERYFGVRRWKGLLPDGARWVGGVFAKRTLASSNPVYLCRFIQETRRGELCHWAAMSLAPLFFVWNPWWGDWAILFYAIAANLPCIIVQRYNRTRLEHVVARVNRKPNCKML